MFAIEYREGGRLVRCKRGTWEAGGTGEDVSLGAGVGVGANQQRETIYIVVLQQGKPAEQTGDYEHKKDWLNHRRANMMPKTHDGGRR